MKKSIVPYLIFAMLMLSLACNSNQDKQLLVLAKDYFIPIETSTGGVQVNQGKVNLGKRLYFEKRLSKDNSTSCNSCHRIDQFGVDNLKLSNGVGGASTKRNSPSIFYTSFHASQFWDGRATTLRDQIRMPIMTEGEMEMPNEKAILKVLNTIEGYKEEFQNIYPDSNEITMANMSDAVASFIESMVYPSRFDDYLNGNLEALNSEELKGMRLFIDKGCVDCHEGKIMGGDSFERFGQLGAAYWDYTKSIYPDSGRYLITGVQEDIFVFKVPSLRNVAKTQPYFHDGSVARLEDAIKIMGELQLNIELTDEEVSKILSFLNSLTQITPSSPQG